MSFNLIDVVLVALIGLNLLNGYRRGFILGVLDLAAWALCLLAGLRFYEPVARWLAPRVDLWSEMWDQPVAFVLVALLVGVFVHLIGYALLRRMPRDVHERRRRRCNRARYPSSVWCGARRTSPGVVTVITRR